MAIFFLDRRRPGGSIASVDEGRLGQEPHTLRHLPNRLIPYGGKPVNAAFVLVTAALLTGDHSGGGCSSCGTATVSSCNSCCQESFGHRLQGRLRGLFSGGGCHKDSCCADTCSSCAPAPAPAPAPACNTCNSCDTCGHHRHFARTSCDSCDNGGGGLLGRLRGMFNRGGSSCGCEASSSCGTCSSCGTAAPPAAGAAPAPAPAGGEAIKDAPKKLPPAPKGDRSQVQTEPAPFNAPDYQPVIQNRPAAVAVPSSLRNPF